MSDCIDFLLLCFSNIFGKVFFLQGIDSSLIPTISFPAFATHEDVLYDETKAIIIRKLKGSCGFKRFGRDGFKCKLEDTKRRYYRDGEIKVFQ